MNDVTDSTESAEEATRTQVMLERINRSIINQLKKIIKGNLAADLAPTLREASCKYSQRRAKYINRPPKR
jgi:hypothetical protein